MALLLLLLKEARGLAEALLWWGDRGWYESVWEQLDMAGEGLGDSRSRWFSGDMGSFLTYPWGTGRGEGDMTQPGEDTCRGESACSGEDAWRGDRAWEGAGECRGDCRGD